MVKVFITSKYFIFTIFITSNILFSWVNAGC